MKRRDPMMQNFDHAASLAEVRSKIANENSIFARVRWFNVFKVIATLAIVALLWKLIWESVSAII